MTNLDGLNVKLELNYLLSDTDLSEFIFTQCVHCVVPAPTEKHKLIVLKIAPHSKHSRFLSVSTSLSCKDPIRDDRRRRFVNKKICSKNNCALGCIDKVPTSSERHIDTMSARIFLSLHRRPNVPDSFESRFTLLIVRVFMKKYSLACKS